MSRQGDAASGSGDETSTEWEAETEDEDEAGARALWDSADDESTAGIYIATVSDEVLAFSAHPRKVHPQGSHAASYHRRRFMYR